MLGTLLLLALATQAHLGRIQSGLAHCEYSNVVSIGLYVLYFGQDECERKLGKVGSLGGSLRKNNLGIVFGIAAAR